MTAVGWRKRRIADQSSFELANQRIDLARECVELRALLNDSRYFTIHYGMSTATESEKLARVMHLDAVNKILGLDAQNAAQPSIPLDI